MKNIKKFWCLFVAALICLSSVLSRTDLVLADNYSNYSTKVYGWGLVQNKEHKVPDGPVSASHLKKYGAYYVGNSSGKNIYLTFDCGYELGYTSKILDTLKANKIKAVFFVTKYFVENNPELVKRMKAEGHLVGNHTSTHPDLSACSVDKIKDELKTLEKVMKEKVGFGPDKLMRPPMGKVSDKTMKVIQDMGYRIFFWSLAWYDYDADNQPAVSTVVGKFETYYHPGMIPLIHNTSSADTAALQSIIDTMNKKGYSFKRVDDIYKKNPKLKVKISNTVYDGKGARISVKTKSDGKVKITYYSLKMKKIKKPENVGSYYVVVKVLASNTYRAASVKKKFKIVKSKAHILVKMSDNISENQEYEPEIETDNTKGKISVMYYDEMKNNIEKPTVCGNYYLQVKVNESKNYLTTYSEFFPFEILQVDL